MIPPIAPVPYGPLLDLERRRLLHLLRSLDPDRWQAPTACPGWSVLGLTVHLVGNDLSLVSWQRDGHRGTEPPPGLDERGFIGWLDRLQIEWVDAARRLSPDLAIELLDWLGDRTTATVTGQDPTTVDATVSWASGRPVPRWLDHARELTERWIHRQQLLEAVGEPADLRADLADPVLDALRWAYPHRLNRHVRPAGASVEIQVTGEHLGRRWILASNGRTWRFSPTATELVASMMLTGEQAWRLLTNNYRRDDHGAIETSGDPELIDALIMTRAIIGEPDQP